MNYTKMMDWFLFIYECEPFKEMCTRPWPIKWCHLEKKKFEIIISHFVLKKK